MSNFNQQQQSQQQKTYLISLTLIFSTLIFLLFQQRVINLTYQQANPMMGGIQSTWYGLDMQGWYLPDFNASCINTQYLLGVATNRFYRIKKDEVKQGTLLKSVKKKELCEILQTLTPNQNLGFKFKTCPNKDWLVNVIYTLKKTHEVFSKPSEIQQNIQMTENDYMLLQQLDTSIGRPKQLRFFRRTEQQIIELKIKKKDRKLNRIKRQIKDKEVELQMQKRQLQEQQLKAIQAELKKTSMEENYQVLNQKKLQLQQGQN